MSSSSNSNSPNNNNNQAQVKKCDASRLKEGTWLSRNSYIRIKKVCGDGRFEVENTDGNSWRIAGEILEAECYAADQHTQVQKVTRTQLARRLRDAGHSVVQCKFHKQVTAKQVADQLKVVQENEPDTFEMPKKRRKLATMLITGADRIMTCHLKRDTHGEAEEEFGRSKVMDLEQQDYRNSERQVDHRTLDWAIIEGVKYETK